MNAEQILEQVANILFPPDEPRGENGTVDFSADGNLEAAIIDLEIRGADKVCISTLNNVLIQLTAARVAMGAASNTQGSDDAEKT
jgi:hypothetical protein